MLVLVLCVLLWVVCSSSVECLFGSLCVIVMKLYCLFMLFIMWLFFRLLEIVVLVSVVIM